MAPAWLTVRKATALAICLPALILGCEKKEGAEEQPVRVVRPSPKPPAGMVPIGEDTSVFISQKPLTISQYLAYLRATEQPVPERWQAMAPDTPGVDQPITGLSRQEAAWCGAWHLRRLPTPEEWQEAGLVVGPRPYPWSDDGAPVVAEAEVLLVQDWPPGSDAELRAREVKENLTQTILSEFSGETEELRKQLHDVVATHRTRRDEMWKQLKPAFFSLLDKEKKLAEERARRESRTMAFQILSLLALDKGELALSLKTADPSAEEAERAADAYGEKLATWRTTVQGIREELQATAKSRQEDVLALTKVFEQSGASAAAGGLEQAETALEESAAAIEGLEQAARIKQKLQSAIGQMTQTAPALPTIPSVNDISARATVLDKQIEQLAGEDPTSARIEDICQKLDRFGEVINREFLQEKLLVQELEELVELRARKKAVEAKLNGLREALEAAPAPGGQQ